MTMTTNLLIIRAENSLLNKNNTMTPLKYKKNILREENNLTRNMAETDNDYIFSLFQSAFYECHKIWK